jgi:thiamine-monophosphate kinase
VDEFGLIARYFAAGFPARRDVRLGVGDDAALCLPPPGMELAIAIDTLVAGVHFPLSTAPADIGYKALAVNLSDLAAMAAEPAWFTLALTCPQADPAWLAEFSHGLRQAAELGGVALIGGDTTRGPLSVTVQITGFAPPGQALRRNGARPGDGIYVTGTLGDAGLALRGVLAGTPVAPELLQRLNRPTPRIQEALALRGIATSAIDISDGLLADLGHILEASGVGANVRLAQIPLSPVMREAGAWELALSAGDDYELCFTAPDHAALPANCTRIGVIDAAAGLRCFTASGGLWQPETAGYQHF